MTLPLPTVGGTRPLPAVGPRYPAPTRVQHLGRGVRLFFLLATIATGGPVGILWAYVEWIHRRDNRAEVARFFVELGRYDHEVNQRRITEGHRP